MESLGQKELKMTRKKRAKNGVVKFNNQMVVRPIKFNLRFRDFIKSKNIIKFSKKPNIFSIYFEFQQKLKKTFKHITKDFFVQYFPFLVLTIRK